MVGHWDMERDHCPLHLLHGKDLLQQSKALLLKGAHRIVQHDDRKTKFGAFMRKCSLDEFPQFFNVLKGDMSLVGPRPEVPFYVDQFKDEIPLYMVKHQVRPGITGWAQVNGLRGDTSIKARVEHDIYYIEHWRLLFDLKILLITVFKGKFMNEEKLD